MIAKAVAIRIRQENTVPINILTGAVVFEIDLVVSVGGNGRKQIVGLRDRNARCAGRGSRVPPNSATVQGLKFT